MTTRRRCGVCGRVLSLTRIDAVTGTTPVQFCPDRACILYPPVTTSRADDPTMVTYLVTVVTCTEATPHKLAKALGMSTGSGIVRQMREQTKRWNKVP